MSVLSQFKKEEMLLSVIVTTLGGPSSLRKCLDSLAHQKGSHSIEVIVPYDPRTDCMQSLGNEFPHVRFVEMDVEELDAAAGSPAAVHEIFDRGKSVGLKVAIGELLALLDDVGVPDPDWCEQTLEAHRLEHGAIGGAVEHSGNTCLNWATYFQDFGRYQLPLTEGPADYLSDVNICYKRSVLESVKDLWIEQYNEVNVNWALAHKGVVLWLRPQMIVRYDRGPLTLPKVLSERFAWGRLFGCTRSNAVSSAARLAYVFGSPLVPILLIGRIARKLFTARRNRIQFLRSLPSLLLSISAWNLGEFFGYVTGRASSN